MYNIKFFRIDEDNNEEVYENIYFESRPIIRTYNFQSKDKKSTLCTILSHGIPVATQYIVVPDNYQLKLEILRFYEQDGFESLSFEIDLEP